MHFPLKLNFYEEPGEGRGCVIGEIFFSLWYKPYKFYVMAIKKMNIDARISCLKVIR